MSHLVARLTLGWLMPLFMRTACKRQATEILSGLKTKWDVMRITVDGVLIGDQVYDSYLRFFNEPTVQLADERLKNVLIQALRIFYAARDYLERTKVTAFITDDFSYINSGIITRLMYRAKVAHLSGAFWGAVLAFEARPGLSGAGHNYPPPVCLSLLRAYRRLFAALSKEKQSAAFGQGSPRPRGTAFRKVLPARPHAEHEPTPRRQSESFTIIRSRGFS